MGTARVVGLLALVLAARAAGAVTVLTRRAGPVAESERIRQRYGSMIVPVLPMATTPGRPVVEVPDVDSLVKIAERYHLLVLTWSRGDVDTYVVQDEGATYRFRSGALVPEESVPV